MYVYILKMTKNLELKENIDDGIDFNLEENKPLVKQKKKWKMKKN